MHWPQIPRFEFRIASVLIPALVFLYPLVLASHIPLLDPDEGLHASIAQEMVERGDWIVPRLFGEPFLDKPILYFWCEALSLRLWGMSEAAVRLPGLLLGLAGAVTTAAVAGRLFDRRTGLVAGLCYATTILPAALAQAAAHDVALVPLVNLSLLLFWEADQSPIPNPQSPPAAPSGYPARPLNAALTALNGLVLGLAILTKGLAGVAIVGIAYGGYLLAARRLRLVHCLRGTVALIIAVAVAAGWYLAVEHRCEGYLRYYFVERHMMGFATGTQRHGGAHWWYYLPVLLGGGLPWVAYLPVTFYDAWRQRRRSDLAPPSGGRPLVLLGCWLVGGTLFLSLGHAKLVTYVWPLFPAVPILTAAAWSRLIDGRLSQPAARWLGAVVWGSCLLGPLLPPGLLLVVQRTMAIPFSAAAWTTMILAGLTAWIPLAFWRTGRPQKALAAAMLAMAAQFAVTMTVALPPVAELYSARELATYVNHVGRLPGRLFLVNERVGSLVFYLDRDLRADLPADRIASLDVGGRPPVFAAEDLIAVPDRAAAKALPWLRLGDAAFQQAGHYRVYGAAAGRVLRGP